MTRDFLSQVYRADGPDAIERIYDDWAAAYDADLAANGYATARRVAQALARHADPSGAVLDFGCGTGLSGVALRAAGLSVIDGCDISAAMLDGARETGAYRRLWRNRPGAPLGLRPGDYAAIAAAAVISPGAAEAETLDMLADALAPGGLLAFSFNDHALSDPAYAGRLAALIDSGQFSVLEQSHGDHLPGIDLKATVYVLEKT